MTEHVDKIIRELEDIVAYGGSDPEVREYLNIISRVVPALVVDMETAAILYATPTADEMFGYMEGELRTKSVHELVPDDRRERHRKHFAEYTQHPLTRPMGQLDMVLEGVKRDGATFTVDIGLYPIVTRSGKRIVIAALLKGTA